MENEYVYNFLIIIFQINSQNIKNLWNFRSKDSFSQPCPPFRGNSTLPMPGLPRKPENEKPVRSSLNANDTIPNDCEIIIASKELR